MLPFLYRCIFFTGSFAGKRFSPHFSPLAAGWRARRVDMLRRWRERRMQCRMGLSKDTGPVAAKRWSRLSKTGGPRGVVRFRFEVAGAPERTAPGKDSCSPFGPTLCEL